MSFLQHNFLLLLLIFIALANTGSSEEENQAQDSDLEQIRQETLFISLGSTCGPAGLLRNFGLRNAAFPFDWVFSLDGEKLIEILDEEFLDFTNEESLVPNNFVIQDADGAGLYHLRYHLEFLHDGDWKGAGYQKMIEEFKSKYERRIERFKSLRKHKEKVYFIRNSWPDAHIAQGLIVQCEENNEISEKYALRLSAALRKFFPTLNFTLIVINFDINPREILSARELLDGSIEVRLAKADFTESLKKYLWGLHDSSVQGQ